MSNRIITAAAARGRNAIPARVQIITALSRVSLGVLFLVLARVIPLPWLAKLTDFAGHMFSFMAVFGLFGHVEYHVMCAVDRLIEVWIEWRQGRAARRERIAQCEAFAAHIARGPRVERELWAERQIGTGRMVDEQWRR